MQVTMADLPAQHRALKNELARAFDDVMLSCRFINGESVEALEREIADICGARHGIGVNSGTDALLLSLRTLDIGPGDEVITAPFTFGATAETIRLVGATPVFADIDPQTFNLDPAQSEAKLTPRTKAIMPVHLFGQLANMTRFREIATKHDLSLIGDAAQAIGATHFGKPIGEWTELTTLSFYPTKNLGACGDGGMILTDTPERDARLRRLRNHGSSRYAFYDEIGYTARLDELQAAFLRVKLACLHEWNEARRRHAALYESLLGGLCGPIFLPVTEQGNTHIYHQYTIRVADGKRDTLKDFLAARGVSTAIYYPLSLHLHPPYADLGGKPGDLPESERVTREVLSLPVHPEMQPGQAEYVAAQVCAFFG